MDFPTLAKLVNDTLIPFCLPRDHRALDKRFALDRARLTALLGYLQLPIRDVLIDVGARARRAGDDSLDELGHLGHNVDAVDAGTQRAAQFRGRARCSAGGVCPGEGGGAGLGPAGFRVVDNVAACCGAGGARAEEVPVGGEAGDVDGGAAIGGWCGEGHHDGAVSGRLEVGEVPGRG